MDNVEKALRDFEKKEKKHESLLRARAKRKERKAARRAEREARVVNHETVTVFPVAGNPRVREYGPIGAALADFHKMTINEDTRYTAVTELVGNVRGRNQPRNTFITFTRTGPQEFATEVLASGKIVFHDRPWWERSR